MNADKLLSDDDTLPSDDNDELGGLEYEQRRIGRAMALAMRRLGWAVAHDDRAQAKEHLDKIIALARELYAAENPPTRVEAAAENRRRAKARAEKKRLAMARADAEAVQASADLFAEADAGGLH